LAVRIRLARAGAKKKPFYRVVVTDSRSPRDGRFIEIVGRYNPRTNPSTIEIDVDRINEWISKGASPSETVAKLLEIAQAPDTAVPETTKDKKISKKAQEKAASEAKAKEAPVPVEAEPEEAPVEADESPEEASKE